MAIPGLLIAPSANTGLALRRTFRGDRRCDAVDQVRNLPTLLASKLDALFRTVFMVRVPFAAETPFLVMIASARREVRPVLRKEIAC